MKTAAGCEIGTGLAMVVTNRVMSMMSLWCLYCWFWACFRASSCVSFVDYERVIADCLDMPLLYLNF